MYPQKMCILQQFLRWVRKGRLPLKKFIPYILIFAAAAAVYAAVYAHSGSFSPFAVNHFNSYSIQAASWLEGRLDVENISWLEIAEFNGRYFISFPPFPSIVMLPLVAIFGTATPDHAVALVMSFASLFFAYRLALLLLEANGNRMQAAFFALFLILGTNYLHVSLWGGVWYLAQNMAFLLTLIAFYFALTKNHIANTLEKSVQASSENALKPAISRFAFTVLKGVRYSHSYISLFAMCAAIGCRPFNAIYAPLVMWLIYLRETNCANTDENPDSSIFRRALTIFGMIRYAIPAIALGAFFSWLNFARFGSIFEFGHNFLPEFTADPHGQFYLGRVPGNLQSLFAGFNILDTPQFGAFAFWVASPIVAVYAVYLVVYAARGIGTAHAVANDLENREGEAGNRGLQRVFRRSLNGLLKYVRAVFHPPLFVIPVLVLVHIFLFSLHRTLGGHQFGARYTVDVLPAVFLGLMLLLKDFPGNNALKSHSAAIFGFALNFYGTIDFFRFYF
ncbi:MAG: hypothetical protein FWC70_09460 [Defluviitaleaceae bacterium]|nr:hypothetical protein [Defluviitaleaceae bacterium]